MNTHDAWRKSSYSGAGDGNSCVEMTDGPAGVAVRDSKNPAYGTLSFPTEIFTAFVESLKQPRHP